MYFLPSYNIFTSKIMEDINNLFSDGQIPGLFNKTEE